MIPESLAPRRYFHISPCPVHHDVMRKADDDAVQRPAEKILTRTVFYSRIGSVSAAGDLVWCPRVKNKSG